MGCFSLLKKHSGSKQGGGWFRMASINRRDITLGIRREDKNVWEGRTPLPPTYVAKLLSAWTNTNDTQSQKTLEDLKIVVQPCKKRVYSNEDYEKAGAVVQEDLSECDVLLGVKEVPLKSLLSDKIYFFFSHTIKGQPHNMSMLVKLMQGRNSLADYELMVNEQGQRTIMFGYYAGCAGTIDILNGLGDRMLARGYRTPWLQISPCRYYEDVEVAKKSIERVGVLLDMSPPSLDLGPFVFTITGSGNVSTGALSILKCMPHQIVTVEELPRLYTHGYDPRKIYIYQTTLQDYLVKKTLSTAINPDDADTVPLGGFNKTEYIEHPELYESLFHERILPFTTVLINGIYWDAKYPRLVTRAQLSSLIKDTHDRQAGLRIVSIADISCDVEGSLEFMDRVTTIDSPFCYLPIPAGNNKGNPELDFTLVDQPTSKYDIQIMSIDNLPAELPRDASRHFGGLLLPYLETFLKGLSLKEFTGEVSSLQKALSSETALTEHPVLKNAFITVKGKLVEPRFSYLKPLLEKATELPVTPKIEPSTPAVTKRILLLGAGLVSGPVIHYFSNKVGYTMTIAAAESSNFNLLADNVKFVQFDVEKQGAQLESLVQQHDIVVSLLPAKFHPLIAKVCIRYGHDMVTASYISPAMLALNDEARVANVRILNEIGLDPGLDHMTAMEVIDKVHENGGKITSFESYCGGLPAPEDSNNPLGYKFSWSPKGVLLATLNAARYKKAGFVVELKSGQVMQHAIPLTHYKGLALEGYPNRDALDYEDLYGLKEDNVVDMFRGTLRYRGYAELMTGFNVLGLLDTDTNRMRDFSLVHHWSDAMKILLESDVHSFEEALIKKLKDTGIDASRVYEALSWLGVFSLYEPFVTSSDSASNATTDASGVISEPRSNKSLLDAFCALLEKKLKFENEERDFVILSHVFKITKTRSNMKESSTEENNNFNDNSNDNDNDNDNDNNHHHDVNASTRSVQEHTCTLVMYGDKQVGQGDSLDAAPRFTAMAKTVGYPVALATELLLSAPKPIALPSKSAGSSDCAIPTSDIAIPLPATSSSAFIPLGVLLPTHKAIYQPILKACPKLGIHFKHTITTTPTLFH